MYEKASRCVQEIATLHRRKQDVLYVKASLCVGKSDILRNRTGNDMIIKNMLSYKEIQYEQL